MGALDHTEDQDQARFDLIPDEPHLIYLIDRSWPIEDLFEIARTHDLVVIDHHESFAEEVCDNGRFGYPGQSPFDEGVLPIVPPLDGGQ